MTPLARRFGAYGVVVGTVEIFPTPGRGALGALDRLMARLMCALRGRHLHVIVLSEGHRHMALGCTACGKRTHGWRLL